jgi:hypothetical protein
MNVATTVLDWTRIDSGMCADDFAAAVLERIRTD